MILPGLFKGNFKPFAAGFTLKFEGLLTRILTLIHKNFKSKEAWDKAKRYIETGLIKERGYCTQKEVISGMATLQRSATDQFKYLNQTNRHFVLIFLQILFQSVQKISLILIQIPSVLENILILQTYYIFHMKQAQKDTQSVKDLVYLLQHPKKLQIRRSGQSLIDRQQVKKSMRLRWKDPGFCNVEFQKAPNLKATILSQWQIERINMASRSYQTPKETLPYRFDQKSRQFPKLSFKLYPIKFQRYLKQVQSQNEDLLFKEKRAKTLKSQGRYLSQMLDNKQLGIDCNFKPVSTTTSYFGLSSSIEGKRKLAGPHFRTLNI